MRRFDPDRDDLRTYLAEADAVIEQAAREARRGLFLARQAAGHPQQDDRHKPGQQCAAEALDLLEWQREWHAYDTWKRQHPWTWRHRTYPRPLPALPEPAWH